MSLRTLWSNRRVLKTVMDVNFGSLSRNLGTQSSTPFPAPGCPQAMFAVALLYALAIV